MSENNNNNQNYKTPNNSNQNYKTPHNNNNNGKRLEDPSWDDCWPRQK